MRDIDLAVESLEAFVDKEIFLRDMPAVKILERQIDTFIQKHKPGTNASSSQIEDFLVKLGTHFYARPLYERISERTDDWSEDWEPIDNMQKSPERHQEIASKVISDLMPLQSSPFVTMRNGWLYFTRMVCAGPLEVAYRIYLSPRPEDVGKIFHAVTAAIPDHVSIQAKTNIKVQDYHKMTRLDKIIIYVPEEGKEEIFEAIKNVHFAHTPSFRGRPTPGGGKPVDMEGVSALRQPKDKKLTGTGYIADKIDGSFKKEAIRFAVGRLYNLQCRSVAEGLKYPEWRIFHKFALGNLQTLREGRPTPDLNILMEIAVHTVLTRMIPVELIQQNRDKLGGLDQNEIKLFFDKILERLGFVLNCYEAALRGKPASKSIEDLLLEKV